MINKGFTLMEIMIVFAIIGLLLAVLIPSCSSPNPPRYEEAINTGFASGKISNIGKSRNGYYIYLDERTQYFIYKDEMSPYEADEKYKFALSAFEKNNVVKIEYYEKYSLSYVHTISLKE